MMCPECGHEWNPEEVAETTNAGDDSNALIVKDANGNVLQDGDTVVLIKDLPVTDILGIALIQTCDLFFQRYQKDIAMTTLERVTLAFKISDLSLDARSLTTYCPVFY